MGLLARYRIETPVPVTVRWALPASSVAASLARAVAREHLATAEGGARNVYRLTGTVSGREVALRVGISATHRGSQTSLAVTGTIHDVGAGAELRARLVVPGAASGTWILVMAAGAVIVVLSVVAGQPWAVVMGLLVLVGLVFSPEIRQRRLRRLARDLAAILAAVPAWDGTRSAP
jgi:hypothetical protein